MDTSGYTYDKRLWKPSPTKVDNNNFFHAAFGTRNSETEEYTDRSVHIRRNNWKNFLSYRNETNVDVSEVVTVEDIFILATLENIKIVIISKSELNSPNIITPDEAILQNYPYRPAESKKEVVLLLQNGFFSRMEKESVSESYENNVENHEEDQDSHSEVDENNARSETNGYGKGGSAGFKGIQYQIGLLIIFLLNAFLKLEKWKLSTEDKDAGKFDDVVIEWPKGTILLQSKFKESKEITLKDLISDNSKNDDFSIPKYFLYHQKVRSKFKKIKHLIICTNAGIHKNMKEYLTPQDICSSSMLHYKSSNSQFYTFNEEKFLPILEEKSMSYYDKNNCKDKGIEKSAITKKNLKDFLKLVQFYCNYPLQNCTEGVIENLLSLNKLQGKISPWEINSKIMNWYQEKKGVYMNYLHAKAKFHEICRDRYYQALEQYDVLFQNKDWNDQNPIQVFHIVTKTGYLLHELKIYRDLQDNKKKILYVGPTESIDVQREIINAFAQLPYIFLVIIWPNGTKDSVIKDICCQLKNTLNEGKKFKKIILVAEENILSRQNELVTDDYIAIEEYVTFQKLSDDTKQKLLSYKGIIFQGNEVNLNELFAPKKVEDYPEALNLDNIQKLVKEEGIKVGMPVPNIDEQISKCYVQRNFKREIQRNEEGLKGTERTELYSQDSIYSLNEKVVLITSSSGTGKTIELTKLAVDLKKKYSGLWVMKIELKDCAGILKKHTSEKETIDIKKCLNLKDNHLEECVFSIDGKVILLLDGIDEVSHYTLITDLIIQCKDSPNFVKIYATSKPHATQELEKKLKTNPFVLQPFTRQDQVDFLKRYLAYKFKPDRETCERYANTLMEMLSGTNINNNSGNHFTAIPLQAKIAAEHFPEWMSFEGEVKCSRYSNGEVSSLNLPEVTFITKLFDELIETKRKDYVNKLDSNRNPIVSQALTEQFNKCLTCHKHVALEVILDDTKRKLFSHYPRNYEDKKTLALEMGLLRRSNNKFHFECETFAEYFFAKNLIKELKVNQEKDFQKFFLEDILLKPNFKVVRGFFNSLLLSEKAFTFKNYSCFTSEIADHLKNENCSAILQLIYSDE